MDARVLASTVVVGSLALFPCAEPPAPTQFPAPEYGCFVNAVEPELLASCAFAGCHGKAERPMRLYSPAANRIGPNVPPDGLTEDEHRANYDRVRAYAARTSAELPDLLRKPLQLEAGGGGHGGVDPFGRNVYASKDDPRWQILRAWVEGDAGTCGGPDAGAGDDGGVPVRCVPSVYSYAANIAPIVNPTRCSDSACHTAQNVQTGDAGCFLPDSCATVLASGCGTRRSVLPCDFPRSKLYLYTGVLPYKAHQGKLTSTHRQAIADWIDAGAPCD